MLRALLFGLWVASLVLIVMSLAVFDNLMAYFISIGLSFLAYGALVLAERNNTQARTIARYESIRHDLTNNLMDSWIERDKLKRWNQDLVDQLVDAYQDIWNLEDERDGVLRALGIEVEDHDTEVDETQDEDLDGVTHDYYGEEDGHLIADLPPTPTKNPTHIREVVNIYDHAGRVVKTIETQGVA